MIPQQTQPKQGGLNSLRHFFNASYSSVSFILLIRKIILWTLAPLREAFAFVLLPIRLRWLKYFSFKNTKNYSYRLGLDVLKDFSLSHSPARRLLLRFLSSSEWQKGSEELLRSMIFFYLIARIGKFPKYSIFIKKLWAAILCVFKWIIVSPVSNYLVRHGGNRWFYIKDRSMLQNLKPSQIQRNISENFACQIEVAKIFCLCGKRDRFWSVRFLGDGIPLLQQIFRISNTSLAFLSTSACSWCKFSCLVKLKTKLGQ